LYFFNLWPNWGATLYGEVRGASDFKRNFWSMAAGLIATTILALIVLGLIASVIGWDFYNAANFTYYEGTSPFGAYPYPALLVSFLTDSPLADVALNFDERLVLRLVRHRIPLLNPGYLCRRFRPHSARVDGPRFNQVPLPGQRSHCYGYRRGNRQRRYALHRKPGNTGS
jgi:hypothetical protein